ncbi:hypothetical protein BRC68_00130 [Halobacteriales archaeon QH_6_64_20]|nr:MAG: hypothetical protein BRC68_00130 [Halobacteriales archaeon QH_6_64_20]
MIRANATGGRGVVTSPDTGAGAGSEFDRRHRTGPATNARHRLPESSCATPTSGPHDIGIVYSAIGETGPSSHEGS